MSNLVGKILDRKYRLVRLLGKGGMAEVYEAEHMDLARRVAVKVMHAEFAGKEIEVERFFLEARAANAIGHPNIVEIFDIGREDDGTVFIVMELLKGRDLDSLLSLKGRLPVNRAVSVTLQVLSALHTAHRKGIVHRDIKPGNVFMSIDKRGREEIKLLDFGVAMIHDPKHADLKLTMPGMIMGTPAYISPEQVRCDKEIDHRIDIWAVGVMLYEMLTGELPFHGEEYNEILSKVLLEEHPPLKEAAPGIPDDLCAVVDRALAKKREDRFGSAIDMLGALQAFEGPARDMMSSRAGVVLRTSIPPPPPPPLPPPPASKTTSESGESDAPWKADTISFNEGALNVKTGARRGLTMAAAGLTAVAVAAVALFFTLDEGHDDKERESRPIAPVAAPLAVSEKVEPTAVKKRVAIDLAGLPEGARITLDGDEVRTPIEAPMSSKTMILKIEAAGYNIFEDTLIPDRDRTVEVAMEKKTAPKKLNLNKGKKEKKEKKAILDNPFGD